MSSNVPITVKISLQLIDLILLCVTLAEPEDLFTVTKRKNVGLVNRCFMFCTAAWFIIFVRLLEPNLSSAEPDRAAGAAPGGKPPNHQPHKGLCDGAHRHRSCVSQRPPAIQKCQWFLGPTLRRPPHFPRCQAPGLPVCCRQRWSSRRSGELASLLVFPLDEILSS